MNSGGLCREFNILFFQGFPPCMHCKLVGIFRELCNVFFCLCHKRNSCVATDSLCSTAATFTLMDRENLAREISR